MNTLYFEFDHVSFSPAVSPVRETNHGIPCLFPTLIYYLTSSLPVKVSFIEQHSEWKVFQTDKLLIFGQSLKVINSPPGKSPFS